MESTDNYSIQTATRSTAANILHENERIKDDGQQHDDDTPSPSLEDISENSSGEIDGREMSRIFSTNSNSSTSSINNPNSSTHTATSIKEACVSAEKEEELTQGEEKNYYGAVETENPEEEKKDEMAQELLENVGETTSLLHDSSSYTNQVDKEQAHYDSTTSIAVRNRNTNEYKIHEDDGGDEGRVALDDGTIPGITKKQDEEEMINSPLVPSKDAALSHCRHLVPTSSTQTNYHEKLEIPSSSSNNKNKWNFSRFLRILGPGMMVCLADTDGPCLITAAQSGSQYKYSLVLCQLLLIPVLYAAQELTARLAVCTKEGTTALIQQQYGSFWAWFAVTLHVIMCWIGQASEFGSIGQLYKDAFGIDRRITNTVQFIFLCFIVYIGRMGYRITEIVGMAVGSLQFVFVILMFVSQVKVDEVIEGLAEFHFKQSNYEILLAGNIGAVIMPWMLYYQQSAVCERQLKREDLKYERVDTFVGAVLAQLVMASMVIGMGSLRFYGNDDVRSSMTFGDIIKAYAQALSGTTWDSIQPGATSILDIQPTPDPTLSLDQQNAIMMKYETDIDTWYTPTSYQTAKWVTVLGVSGACTVASMVLTITSVWSVTEILHIKRDLFRPFHERPVQYYLQYGGLIAAYACCMLLDISQSWFAILTQTINGLLILPVALFLWLLASSPNVLPKEYRLSGWYKWTLAIVFMIICAYCFYGMVQEIINPV